jgi:SNF2 family DNA or RNA helicase
MHLTKLFKRESTCQELFEDLGPGEYFPQSSTQVDRILDIDDSDISIDCVDWKQASLPSFTEGVASMTNLSEEEPSMVNPFEGEAGKDNFLVEMTLGDEGSNDFAALIASIADEGPEPDQDQESKALVEPSPTLAFDDQEVLLFDDLEEMSSPTPKKNQAAVSKINDEAMAVSSSSLGLSDMIEPSSETSGEQVRSMDESKDIGLTTTTRKRQKKADADAAIDTADITEKSKSRKVKRSQYPHLHGRDCWVLVKWEGMPYYEATLEHVQDLHNAGVDYEGALRKFYRREQLAPVKKSSGNASKRASRVLDASVLESDAPPFGAGALRDYQWEGVRWLLFNWSQKRGSILADEMGLGKTIQTAAFLQMLRQHQGLRGPFLIIAPLAVIYHWQRSISAWTDMDVIVYHGSQEDRDIIRDNEFKYVSGKEGFKLEVVVTTPETCLSYDNKAMTRRELSKIRWDFVIIDEAHKIKNYDSKLTSTLRDDYEYESSLLLTGTPLQNSTEELWTLLNFVARREFDDKNGFIDEFGELKTTSQLDKLHKKLKPYLLRREKEHVETSVPKKEEIVVEVEMTVPQKQYYRAIYEMKTGFLYRGEAKDGPSLTNLAMELRKCCNHPFLIKGAEKELAKHFVDDSPVDVLVKSSGKMILLDKLLPKLHRDGHRVLIFSQFRIMLNIIEDYMGHKGYTYERIDGTITGKKRQAAIDRYSAAAGSAPFAMLLSTRAGGVGINLTAADTGDTTLASSTLF